MTSAPIVVHRITGGPESHRARGRDEILGTAYGDHDVVVFLEGDGVAEPEAGLDDPHRVE
ncbi:hypothetical protein SAMN06272771_0037 [Streptomyces sp. Ag82_O1-12]|uniref:hypothetical protein n=1 Tax=unclassified Streptomyces TaxID=2593676 RepID=UPI000BC61D27|nr:MULTISPECIES: hypothetical protein [unclassified Streptomyces]SMQ13769.1 hypothetical protein SAMN06272771_0037 [Streptomyces sp. Ag82_O1-12]SOD42801.1 hypothetical protein SAMN06272727_0026 [Streptomyces sp. Ag82_G6-1]